MACTIKAAVPSVRPRVQKLILDWLAVLDLDRTLFDSGLYFSDVMEWFAQLEGLEAVHTMQEAEKMGDFDVLGFLEQYGISDAQAQIRAYVEKKYPNGHPYLRPGAKELVLFLQRHPKVQPIIITKGASVHQEFKVSFCPELKDLQVYVISGNKGELLQNGYNPRTKTFSLRTNLPTCHPH